MSKKLRKVGTLLLCTALLLTAFAGCGSSKDAKQPDNSGSSEEEKVTITLAMHVANLEEQEPVTYQIIEAFKVKYPDINIEVTGNDKDEHVNKMKLAAQSDELPDIFYMDSSVAPELNEAGFLLDLKEFLSEYEDVDKALNDNMKAAATSDDGVIFGLPYQSLVTGIWYNKEVFKEAGVEEPQNGTTLEELLSMVKTFNENDITPIANGAKDTYSVWSFLIGFERYGYFDKIDDILEGKEKFNNSDFLAYFNNIQKLSQEGAFASNSATMTYFQAKEMFLDGKAAMFDSGQWDAGVISETLGENAGFWWGPVYSDSSYDQGIKMHASSAPLCANAKLADDDAKRDAVYKFLAFYYSQEAADISYAGSTTPATNYTTDVDTSDSPAFTAVIEALADDWVSPENQPDLVLSEPVQAQMYDSIYGVMLGNYTPEEALDKIDTVLAQE